MHISCVVIKHLKTNFKSNMLNFIVLMGSLCPFWQATIIVLLIMNNLHNYIEIEECVTQGETFVFEPYAHMIARNLYHIVSSR
jgi:hypothetical protein